jgi:dihydroorotase
MTVLIKNVRVIDIFAGIDVTDDILIEPDGLQISPAHVGPSLTIDGRGQLLVPGLVDLHVHFREPGFTYKEDIASGIRAALAGGVTSVLVMPNTRPALDQPKLIDFQYKRAKPFTFDLMVAGAASKNLMGEESSDIKNLAQAGVKAVTDDGRPIQDPLLMETILRQCRLNNLVCMQHAEDLGISCGASLNQGVVSKKLGLVGQSSIAESSLVERDIELALKINCRYHVLHLSCTESLQLVKKAKLTSKLITCEASPHHLLLDESDIRGFDTAKKMNPPLRSKEDVQALLSGLCDGTIDAVASDHAPHSSQEKRQPFVKAPFGVVGLESAILVLLTLVKKHGVPLKVAIASMTSGPARVLGDSYRIGTMMGDQALNNAVLIDPNYCGMFSYRNLHGRSKNSPFIGMELFGKVMATFQNGKLVYRA